MLGFTSSSSWEVLGQSDACTEWGCGGLLFDGKQLLGYAREWSADERKEAFVAQRESTGVFEMMGALEWLRRFRKLCGRRRCQLEMDNVSVVLALTRLFSPKQAMMGLLRDVRGLLFDMHACVRVVHVLGRFIAVADRLSHNDIEGARCLAELEFGMPLVLV